MTVSTESGILHLFIVFLDHLLARQHVVEPVQLGLSEDQVHQLANAHQRQQLCNDKTYTHTSLTALCPGLPRRAGTRKVKPIWILLKQETVSGSGISWAICKSTPRSRQTTTPAPHHSAFYRPDALPVAQPTASTH